MNSMNFEKKSLIGSVFPGVIRVFLKTTNKSLFLECSCCLTTAVEFFENLEKNICVNAEFLEDYQKSNATFESLDIFLETSGPIFKNPETRKKELEKCKLNWPKENLY